MEYKNERGFYNLFSRCIVMSRRIGNAGNRLLNKMQNKTEQVLKSMQSGNPNQKSVNKYLSMLEEINSQSMDKNTGRKTSSIKSKRCG